MGLGWFSLMMDFLYLCFGTVVMTLANEKDPYSPLRGVERLAASRFTLQKKPYNDNPAILLLRPAL